MAGYDKRDGFRPRSEPDTVSGATLNMTHTNTMFPSYHVSILSKYTFLIINLDLHINHFPVTYPLDHYTAVKHFCSLRGVHQMVLKIC